MGMSAGEMGYDIITARRGRQLISHEKPIGCEAV